MIIINNKDPTFHRVSDNSCDILDWCIISNNLHQKFIDFKVLNNNLVDSDHLPLLVEFNFSKKTKVSEKIMSSTVKLDYNKANWSGFENDLNIVHPPPNTPIDELNRIIVESIISAKE